MRVADDGQALQVDPGALHLVDSRFGLGVGIVNCDNRVAGAIVHDEFLSVSSNLVVKPSIVVSRGKPLVLRDSLSTYGTLPIASLRCLVRY